MTPHRYIVIQEWMKDLGMTPSELIVFALVFGFCQDGESDFHGSTSYVAEWCGLRREAAVRILQQLVDKGLLVKSGTPGYPAHYSTQGCAILEGVRKSHTGCLNIAQGGCAEIAHDNKSSDNKDKRNTESVLRAREEDGKEAYGEKVRMTPAEYDRIVSRYGAADAATIVQMLDDYLVDHPRKHYANHYRAAIGWPAQRLMEQRTAEQRLKNAQEAGQRVSAQQAAASTWTAEDLARIRKFGEKIDRERNGLQ